jgi:hypothetical protein
MRLGLVCLLLAGAAADPDCGTHAFVRSFHSWTAGDPAHCQLSLAGSWMWLGPDSAEVWHFWQEQGDSSPHDNCGYIVVLGDTALGRSLALAPIADVIFSSDRRARREIAMDPSAMATWADDSARLRGILFDQSRQSLLMAGMDSIGGQLFLDVAPFPRQYEATPVGLTLMMPSQWVFRMEVSEDTLLLYPLSRRWVDSLLGAQPGALTHEYEYDLTLITAPTESLSRFLLHHARDTIAFPPAFADTFVRIRP